MGEWKAQISARVPQELRREMEEFAYEDRRRLGNVAGTLLEWSWEQLKAAGNIETLLKSSIKPRGDTNGSAQNERRRESDARNASEVASARRPGTANLRQPI